jgi:hypothetical protein
MTDQMINLRAPVENVQTDHMKLTQAVHEIYARAGKPNRLIKPSELLIDLHNVNPENLFKPF